MHPHALKTAYQWPKHFVCLITIGFWQVIKLDINLLQHLVHFHFGLDLLSILPLNLALIQRTDPFLNLHLSHRYYVCMMVACTQDSAEELAEDRVQ